MNVTNVEPQYVAIRGKDFGYLILLVLPIVTVCGNILVILAVMTNLQLKQSVTNRLISALAFCDLLVGSFVMPFAVYVKVNHGKWMLGVLLCKAYIACDVAASTASILHLVVISVDRYFAVMYPAEYQRYSRNSKTSFTVVLIWLISATLTIPVLMGKSIINVQHCWLENPEFMLYSSFLSFYIPAIVLTMMYVKLFRKIRKRKGIREALRAFPCTAVTTAPFRLPLTPVPPRVTATESADDPSTQLILDRTTLDSNRKISLMDSPNSTNNIMQITSISSSTSSQLTTTMKINQKIRKRSATVQNLLSDNSLNKDKTCSKLELNSAKSHQMLEENFEDEEDLHTNDDYERLPSTLMRERTETMASKNLSLFSSNDDYRLSFRSSFDVGPNHLLTISENGKYSTASDRAISDLSTNSNSAFRRLVKGLSSAVKRLKDPATLQRERKATKLVAVVLGVFIGCWLPFFTFNVARGICLSFYDSAVQCDFIPSEMFFLTTWLGYANSSVNPFIYALVNGQFRNTYKKLLHLPKCERNSSKSNSIVL